MPGWERLRHGGLLLDATRLAALSQHVPGPLDDRIERQLRQRASAMSETDRDGRAISAFVAFVLEEVCGLDASTPRRLDRRLDPRQPRLPILGAACDHRRDGEAPTSVDGPGRRSTAGVPVRRPAPGGRPGPPHREPGARLAARRQRSPRPGDERPAVAAAVRRARLRRLVRVGPRPVVRGRQTTRMLRISNHHRAGTTAWSPGSRFIAASATGASSSSKHQDAVTEASRTNGIRVGVPGLAPTGFH